MTHRNWVNTERNSIMAYESILYGLITHVAHCNEVNIVYVNSGRAIVALIPLCEENSIIEIN